MSWLGWGPATNPQYEELVEKYCSPLNLPYPQSEDIATALEVTDLIRSKTVQPKPAMQSLKRRVASKNGRVQMYAIGLVDTCIKNGGDHFLAEIASKEFVDEMSGMIKSPLTSAEVRQMAIKNFQSWALAFESKRELSLMTDVYKELKNSGISFPPPPSTTSSHLLTTTTAPAWIDSDVCMRCRTAFTFTNRKHHCRNCGLVFDQQCSSKTMALPHFGIMEPVRVCDSCHSKVQKNTPAGPAPAVPGRTPRSRQDLDADLQRAIELSLAESQPGGSMMGSEPPLRRQGHGSAEDDDEELRMAIEASLREAEQERPSAPTGHDEPEYKPLPTFDLTPRETETILTFSNTLDQMAAYGERDLRRFPHAHLLYEQAYAVGGKLHRNAEEKRTKQQMLAEMQSKLSQAVGMYGQILDGQQAFAARRMQEQQQRQYQQYNHAPPQHQQYQPYGYASPTPQANGYTPYPQQYQPPPQAAGPSLYPSIPQGQPAYTPQIYQPPQHAQYQPQQAPYQPQPQHQQHYASGAPPNAFASSPPPQHTLDRQHSMQAAAPPLQLQPPQHQRQTSMSYSTEPQGYAIPQQATGGSVQASAPPPVDLASHPSTSPQSARSALPSAPGFSSPTQTTVAMPDHNASIQQQMPPSSLPQAPEQWQQQGYQHPHHTGQTPHEAPPAAAQQNQSQGQAQPQSHSQQQTQQQHVYYPQSFPQAPAAVFPDAPSDEVNKSVEKEEQKEALLIEL